MKKELTLFNFFTIGFGAIIGTGWIMLVGDWMVLGGGPWPAILAFVIGSIFLLPIGMCFGELTAAIPISGGIIEYVDRTNGRSMGFLAGWMLILGNAALCPWETIAISTLLTTRFSKLPGLSWLTSIRLYTIKNSDVYLWPTVIALLFAILVIHLNFTGAGAAAKLSVFLTKALLIGMVLAMIISFITGSFQNAIPVFSRVKNVAGGVGETKATSFFAGVVAVLVMTPFFYAGFDAIPQQAEEASPNINWKRFGIIPAIALLASGFFYFICIYSFGTMMPWRDFVKEPVPALAALQHLPGIPVKLSFFFYLLMLIIATLGPLGPMNAFFGASSRLLLAMGRKGFLPDSYAQLDPQRGTPKKALLVMSVFTLIGPFLGNNMLVPLTNVASLGFIFACMMAGVACLKLRKSDPSLYRPYRVKGGRFVIYCAIVAAAVMIGLMIWPFSPATLNRIEWLITCVWLVIGLLIFILYGAHQKGPNKT